MKAEIFEGDTPDLYGLTVSDDDGVVVEVVEATMPLEEAIAAAQAATTVNTLVTRLEFLRKFTPQERIAMRTLAKTDPVAEDILALMDAVQNINLNDESTVMGLGYFTSVGVLSPARMTEVLGGVNV